MNKLDIYRNIFPNAHLTRSDTDVLKIMLHTNGGKLVFNGYVCPAEVRWSARARSL
jgi:hypothetical protein